MYAVAGESKKINVYPQKDDLCFSCKNILKCPLFAALQDEAVILNSGSGHITVENCWLYKD
ncbi:MAG: hypothetical protein UT41_C0007G0009 [Candidatus Wolfebacteria bacterium GW2011_GWC2_39_22]|uniref:Uncharacterized protein n=1 Tax=Candidatus Wolfebacteria bacterium GW2011_GWC2_39_22 TaxID=1619013 RepID=A0A0G0NFZ3_9BACT|nr:MAG: hypothetical protein UT41_C0007G0009 [Candidatus Wolfebacteria bacterium GW2011_GWC2_39_22]